MLFYIWKLKHRIYQNLVAELSILQMVASRIYEPYRGWTAHTSFESLCGKVNIHIGIEKAQLALAVILF